MSNSNSSSLLVEGVVLENLPNTMFRVKITRADQADLVEKTILCHLAGKMRLHYVKLLPGDKIRCEVSLLDTTKGRIVQKFR